MNVHRQWHHGNKQSLLTLREAFVRYLTLHALSGKRDRLTNRRLVEGVKFLVKPTKEVNILIIHFFTQARYTIRCLLCVIKPFDLSPSIFVLPSFARTSERPKWSFFEVYQMRWSVKKKAGRLQIPWEVLYNSKWARKLILPAKI